MARPKGVSPGWGGCVAPFARVSVCPRRRFSSSPRRPGGRLRYPLHTSLPSAINGYDFPYPLLSPNPTQYTPPYTRINLYHPFHEQFPHFSRAAVLSKSGIVGACPNACLVASAARTWQATHPHGRTGLPKPPILVSPPRPFVPCSLPRFFGPSPPSRALPPQVAARRLPSLFACSALLGVGAPRPVASSFPSPLPPPALPCPPPPVSLPFLSRLPSRPLPSVPFLSPSFPFPRSPLFAQVALCVARSFDG